MPFEWTKRQLRDMTLTKLKDVARKNKVSGFSKYKASNKDELMNLIWKKMGVSVTPLP